MNKAPLLMGYKIFSSLQKRLNDYPDKGPVNPLYPKVVRVKSLAVIDGSSYKTTDTTTPIIPIETRAIIVMYKNFMYLFLI